MECLSAALQDEEKYFVFGGVTGGQLRRALAVTEWGAPSIAPANPCINCKRSTVIVQRRRTVKVTARCANCGLTWQRRRQPGKDSEVTESTPGPTPR